MLYSDSPGADTKHYKCGLFVGNITPAMFCVSAARGVLISATLRAACHKHFGSEIEWLKQKHLGYCGQFFVWLIAFIDMEIHAGNMVLIIKFIWISSVECWFRSVIMNSSFSSFLFAAI